jgi:hypothetical protein
VNAPKDAPIDLRLRRATADDRSAIIELCRRSLGWKAGDPNEAFFEWKHDDNPFGPSPTWVAEDDTAPWLGCAPSFAGGSVDPTAPRSTPSVRSTPPPTPTGRGEASLVG